jgi:hypothetical protein
MEGIMQYIGNEQDGEQYDFIAEDNGTRFFLRGNELRVYNGIYTNVIYFVKELPPIEDTQVVYLQTVAPKQARKNIHIYTYENSIDSCKRLLGPLIFLYGSWEIVDGIFYIEGEKVGPVEDVVNGNYVQCHECKEWHLKTDMNVLAGGGFVCINHDEYVECNGCGEYVHENDATQLGSDSYCDSCRDTYLARCNACGDWINTRDDDYMSDDYRSICYSCRDEYYYCEDCGCIVHQDNACFLDGGSVYCESCVDSHAPQHIHRYHEGPDPTFFGKGPRFFGFELETDGASDYNVDRLFNMSENETMFHLERDGSLNTGFELVSGACSFEHIMEHKEYWKKVCDEIIRIGLRSHDTETCGFHIHVSRDGINGGNETISNIVYLYEKHFQQFLRFSRRTEKRLNVYAARYIGENVTTLDEAKAYTKTGRHLDRYKAINLRPEHTIEFRFFKGTLNIDTIMANIQLINNLVDIANTETIESITFDDILNYRDYIELKAYAIKRGLIKGE